jgi:N-methylhydantoinase A
MTSGVRVAVDIGGTFTDVVTWDSAAGVVASRKVLTTPDDHADAVLDGLAQTVDAADVDWFVHGTTVALNAVLSRSGTRVLLVVTEGFRDMLHLGRAERTDIWKLHYRRSQPLVTPADVCAVRERIRGDGRVQLPLDEASLDEVVDRIEPEGMDSVAVCLINAHRNGVHERRVRELLEQRAPGVRISLSHEVAPQIREYERASTTVMDAYVARPVERYLGSLERRSRDAGLGSGLQVMRSNGGTASASLVVDQPVLTLLSGPAGGVVGAERLAAALDRPRLIALDMGGTSLDACLVCDGAAQRSGEMTLDQLPVLLPVISLTTIGAGGGSLARVTDGGLRVGPQSAGSAPGPACYGLGGTEPTVTDANVVLGRIDPESFLEGRMPLDAEAAREAIASIAGPLGLSIEAMAEGVVAVANASMADAVRTLAVRRGFDPREFSLLAFGGAGPVHAAEVADELGIREVVIPQSPGGFSAWGMLHAPVRHDAVMPFQADLETLRPDDVAEAFRRLELANRVLLEHDGVPAERIRTVASADMRYQGQEFVVNVVGDTAAGRGDWSAAFHAEYLRLYAHALPGMPIEVVSLRLSSYAPPAEVPAGGEGARSAGAEGLRQAVFAGRRRPTAVLSRAGVAEDPVAGPAIIEEPGTCTVVPPGWRIRAGEAGVLVLDREERADG